MRGATLPYVVRKGGVPAGASARWDRSLKLNPVTASKAGLEEGAKSRSHRRPYVTVKAGVALQVSCANIPRLWNKTAPLRPDETAAKGELPNANDGTSLNSTSWK